MAKHVHADLMLLYARDAEISDTPWQFWEYSVDGETWHPLIGGGPSWEKHMFYRRSGDREITELKKLYSEDLKRLKTLPPRKIDKVLVNIWSYRTKDYGPSVNCVPVFVEGLKYHRSRHADLIIEHALSDFPLWEKQNNGEWLLIKGDTWYEEKEYRLQPVFHQYIIKSKGQYILTQKFFSKAPGVAEGVTDEVIGPAPWTKWIPS